MKNKLLMTIFIILLTSTVAFSAESSTYFNAVGAYYFDDNRGNKVNNGNLGLWQILL